MSVKRDKTKQDIKEKAYCLFTEKGYKNVTILKESIKFRVDKKSKLYKR